MDELEAKCLGPCEAVGIGASRPELGDAGRMHPQRHYLMFDREREGTIPVERVLIGARGIGSDDFDPDS